MATPAKVVKIGKYDVLDTIGRGGMGVVYLAKDPYLDRLVAIKMMNVDIHENSDFLERFYREAKATASLQHPNIVTVYELGEHQGRPFLVMQYVEGNSLETLLRSHHPLSLLEKLNIVIEVCQGLSYAHQRSIIHRDIKPANIMVLNDGGVKIVDFGIARLGDHTMTRTGQIVGSLYYMSPEQIKEKGIDSRADIYATGVVLYQLLTYALPFEGESTVATLAKIISEEPPPFRQFGVNCPPEVEAITLKTLSKDKDQRYPTAEALALALGEVQQQLKQESVREYLEKADLLRKSKELVQAQEFLLKALKIDRQNTTAAKMLSALRGELQAELSAQRVRQLRQQAEEAFRREDYDTAASFINQAIELESTSELEALRVAIEKAKAEVELVRKAIARAEAAQRSGDLDSAKNAIDTAFSRRPNDSNIKALRRAIERDIEERGRQRKLEELLDAARKQMGERKFTTALDLLREAQKLDASAPQLRVLLDRLATEHQQEKRRKELEQYTREIQEAIDRDDYSAASAKAAEALAKFPSESSLRQLKELADGQMELAELKVYVREQTVQVQELFDSGHALKALECAERALARAPGNARLESLRTMVLDRLAKDRDEADKSTCLAQANEAIGIARYGEAIQLLEAARLRFTDSSDIDELLRFARDQQAKAKREKFVEQILRSAQQLLQQHRSEEAVQLLQSGLQQEPSEELELLLRQAKAQHESFTRDVSAAIAKGKSLLDEGAVAEAREFLGSRPESYRCSADFANLLRDAQNAALPPKPEASDGATRMLSGPAYSSDSPTLVENRTVLYDVSRPPVHPAEQPALEVTPPPRSRLPLFTVLTAVVVVVMGVVVWLLWPSPPKPTTLVVKTEPGAQVFIDERPQGSAGADGTLRISGVVPGQHALRTSLGQYSDGSSQITLKAGQEITASVEMAHLQPPPPPPQPDGHGEKPKLGTLVLKINVPDPDVFVDGHIRKATAGRNGKLNLQLEPGAHTIRFGKSGFGDSKEQRIEITSGMETAPLQVKLTKTATAPVVTGATTPPAVVETYLIIDSTPGAEVRVAGSSWGVVGSDGSISNKVNPGSYDVQISLSGYKPYSGTVAVASGERKSLPAALEKYAAPKASFTADSNTIEPGQSTTLRWSTQNATEVSVTGPGIGTLHQSSGTQTISPGETTTYTLVAKGNGGDERKEFKVLVKAPAPPPPQPDTTTLVAAGHGDADAVRKAIDRYRAGFESMDPARMRQVWLDKKQIDKVVGALLHEQNIRLSEDCSEQPKISGDRASLICTETMSGLRELKPFSDPPHKILFNLQKQADGIWVVASRQLAQ